MTATLGPLFEGLAPPRADRLVYAVAAIPGYSAHFVGKDNNANACLLVSLPAAEKRGHVPIRLENLEVVFDVSCVIRRGGNVTESTFTVVRCRVNEPEVVRYFLSVAETLLRILGPRPSRVAIVDAITKLAQIFQRLQGQATRSVNGLFGELFLIRQSRSPSRALAAWRLQDRSRFDFNVGSVRVEVKTAATRQRIHTFSYDQCNPPSGTTAVVASLFVEQVAGGVSLREIVSEVEQLVAASPELVLKLHDTVATTLGRTLHVALGVSFDRRLSASSLLFYDLRSIPAIRGEPPPGVSDIHFRSDLSSAVRLDRRRLLECEPSLGDFLPVT